MDFKGVSWAGNIYQKFEAMCLEVEEVIYEDTAKYMENQMQKVGVSVKKFYSEVMQDLLPPSCVDPVKAAAGDLSLKPYTYTDINKKPKLSILNSHGVLKKKETEDEDTSDLTAKEFPLSLHNDANHLLLMSPRGLVEHTRSEISSSKCKKVGMHKRPIGIKRISQNNQPPKIISRPTTLLSAESNTLTVCDDMNAARTSDFSVRRKPEGVVNKITPISDASIVSLASDNVSSDSPVSDAFVESNTSDKVSSAESVRLEENDSECTSPASEKKISSESPKQKKDVSDCNSSCHGLPPEPIGSCVRSNLGDSESMGKDAMTSYEDKFGKDGSLSQIDSNSVSNTWGIESLVDNFNMEVIKNGDNVQPIVENFEPVQKSKLEETCILVEEDDHHYISEVTKKHKSYKKKIREALLSKLRLTRKQDLGVSSCKDIGLKNNGGVIPALTMDSGKRKLPADDSFEFEWELL